MEARRNVDIPDFYSMEPLSGTKELGNNLFHENCIAKPVTKGTVLPMSSEGYLSNSKYCVECSHQSRASVPNDPFNKFSDENPSINNNMSEYRSRRVSLDRWLDSSASSTQNFCRAERSGLENGFYRPPDFTYQNGGYVDPFEFSSSSAHKVGWQANNHDMTRNSSDRVQSHSDFHQAFHNLSESFEYESAGDDDDLEPLPVGISYEEDEFVSFIHRTIQDLS